ncbi:MAG: nitroreductase family protein [Candidatus Omnitrophota bacterium]
MDFLKLVQTRRSCRRYINKPVSREVISRCLEAARLAPSACNSQPWHFIVVDSPDMKERLSSKVFTGIYSNSSFAAAAPVIVAVVRERSKYAAKLAGYLRGVRFSLIDLGICIEHFVLTAEEAGLGTCWIGWFNEKEVKKLLNIPKNKKIDILISVGYPENQKPPVDNRVSLGDMSEFR